MKLQLKVFPSLILAVIVTTYPLSPFSSASMKWWDLTGLFSVGREPDSKDNRGTNTPVHHFIQYCITF